MGQTARSREMLRKLAIIDENLVEDQVGLALGLAEGSSLDPKDHGVAPGRGSGRDRGRAGDPGVEHRASAGGRGERGRDRRRAAGHRTSNWAGPHCQRRPEVAIALGYDTDAALEEPGDQ